MEQLDKKQKEEEELKLMFEQRQHLLWLIELQERLDMLEQKLEKQKQKQKEEDLFSYLAVEELALDCV